MAVSTGEGLQPDRSGAREPVGALVVPAQVPGPAPAPAPLRRRTPRHEIHALLRAHLAAASAYRHLTRHCAVCARLLRLAMEPLAASGPPERTAEPVAAPEALEQTARPVKRPGPSERAVGPANALTLPGRAMEPAMTPGPPEQPVEPPAASTQPGRAAEQPEGRQKPWTGPGAPHEAVEPSDTTLARLSDRPQAPARHTPASASTPPGSAGMGSGDRRDPTWAQDESPPAT
ncbi:DUF6274 family protein [Streptomyces sp. LN549]|uniref:DUF6274 family protein n=1 Tax=Streptomyces sp. LN549 TaxID=3112979 RepID=UPI00371A7BAD